MANDCNWAGHRSTLNSCGGALVSVLGARHSATFRSSHGCFTASPRPSQINSPRSPRRPLLDTPALLLSSHPTFPITLWNFVSTFLLFPSRLSSSSAKLCQGKSSQFPMPRSQSPIPNDQRRGICRRFSRRKLQAWLFSWPDGSPAGACRIRGEEEDIDYPSSTG